MKKLIAVILSLTLLLALLPAASAASPVWDGRSSEAYAGGTGTEDDPYLIANGAQLYQLALDGNNSSMDGNYYKSTKGLYYKLTQDIDMGNKSFPGITYFSGNLDGAGYTIRNLKIINTANSYTGLVRQGRYCTIRNLTVRGTVSGADDTGAIVGYLNGTSIIENCANYCVISGEDYVGGICGHGNNSACKIVSCVNLGTISGTNWVGGICGFGYENDISSCVNVAAITATRTSEGYAAGIIGYSYKSVSIEDCYNTGTITGWLASGISYAPSVSAHRVYRSYNCGKLNGTWRYDPVGINSSSASYVYYLADNNKGAENHENAVGLSSEDMTSAGSFVGFDFANVWTWDNSGYYDYPILRTLGVVLLPCEENAHTWNNGTVLSPATCTEDGEQLLTCTKCAMEQKQPIAALGHDMVDVPGKQATCTEPGYTSSAYCSRCDYAEAAEEIPATGHSWDDGVVTTPPTEEAEGVKTYTCTTCSTTKTESIPVLEHSHKYTAVVTAPTCTEQGYTTYTCTCGDSYKGDFAETLGHDMITDPAVPATCTESGLTEGSHCSRCDHKVAQQTVPALGHDMITLPGYPATCTQNGLTSGAYCSRCDRVIPQTVIPATGHSWDNGVVTTPPTEETEGVKTYTCTVCSATKTEPIPVLGHVHSYSSVVTAPTCTEQGYTTYTCSCGDSYRENIVPALGHDATDWIVDLAPTCTVAGSMHTECTRCDALLQTSAIQPSGHSESDWIVDKEATCTEGGAKHKECTACGIRLQTETIPALGHSYSEGSCTRCGAEDPNWTEPEEPFVNPFVDVKERDYFYTPVLWAVQKGITNGTSPTEFSPEDPCTRGQIVTFLWRSFGSPEPTKTENPFVDVSSNMYYYKAVLWAVEQGITTGVSKTEFEPDATCTRGQVATFLWRACGKPAPESNSNPFSDVDSNMYYYQPILWAVEQGVTNGTGGGKFSPEESCTRGQIVTFLYRALAE